MLNYCRSIHLFSASTFTPTLSFYTPEKPTSFTCGCGRTKITPSTYRILSFKSASAVSTATVSDLTTSTVCSAGDDLPENYGYDFPTPNPTRKRRAGVLLHPSSLPGPYGIGDFGEEAFRFLDWLHYSGCSIWQVLPLVPPGRKSNEDGSPYSGQDANCGNTLLISLEELVKDGLLLKEELPEHIDMDKVHFATVADVKDPLVAKAAERLVQSQGELKMQLNNFRMDPRISCWLEDAALFSAIDHSLDTFAWTEWPEPLKNRHIGALEETYRIHKDYVNLYYFDGNWLN